MSGMEAFEERLSSLKPSKLLDVASGPGRSAAGLISSVGGSGFSVACDIDRELLSKGAALTEEAGNVLPVCADSARMPFLNDIFGLVGISNSIHHMEDLELTLNEMVRVLEPGGFFLVREMYRDGQTEAQMTHVLLHEWWADIDQDLGRPHYSTFWRDEILGFLEELELEDISTADHAELDSDPLDPEGLEHVDNAVEAYIKKAVGLAGFEDYRRRGESLRRRVHSIGIHGATGLLFLARKPS